MKKRSFIITVIAIGIGLIGLMAMQAYFIYDSYKLKARLFDQTVESSLRTVAEKVEKSEALNFIGTRITMPAFPDLPKAKPKKKKVKKTVDEIRITNTAVPADPITLNDSILNGRLFFVSPHNRSVTRIKREELARRIKIKREKDDRFIIRIGPDGIVDTVKYKARPVPALPQVVTVNAPAIRPEVRVEKHVTVVPDEQPNEQDVLVQTWLDSVSRFKKRIEVFEKLALEADRSKLSLINRVNPKLLDSLLKGEFKSAGINIDYYYSIESGKDSTVFRSAAYKQGITVKENVYKASLFPKDVLNATGTLTVTFPGKSDFLMNKMLVLITASSLIVLVIMTCFGVTILSLLRQKKLSEMKSDFINNMTHEFKTPVATIMLASEALRDEQMAADKTMVSRYAGIIYDENLRLSSYVERVLNLAKLEKSDLKLEQKPVDMHDLISAVADSMNLQFKRKGARVTINLEATSTTIIGDELHLSNVIYNLLDNALKYSEDDPQITISTQNLGSLLIMKVDDNGIGMTREQQSRVFDQFYRAHTGNLHNVKGFGLGLNYVYSIIKLLKGNITVKSEPQKGSSFELSFSLA